MDNVEPLISVSNRYNPFCTMCVIYPSETNVYIFHNVKYALNIRPNRYISILNRHEYIKYPFQTVVYPLQTMIYAFMRYLCKYPCEITTLIEYNLFTARLTSVEALKSCQALAGSAQSEHSIPTTYKRKRTGVRVTTNNNHLHLTYKRCSFGSRPSSSGMLPLNSLRAASLLTKKGH